MQNDPLFRTFDGISITLLLKKCQKIGSGHISRDQNFPIAITPRASMRLWVSYNSGVNPICFLDQASRPLARPKNRTNFVAFSDSLKAGPIVTGSQSVALSNSYIAAPIGNRSKIPSKSQVLFFPRSSANRDSGDQVEKAVVRGLQKLK